MSLNGIGNQGDLPVSVNTAETVNEPDSNALYSKVIATEKIDDNEKRITIEIPLKDGTIIPVTGTLAELIKLRKELELEGKIQISIQHDDEAAKNLQTVQDITRWNFGGRGSQVVIDLHNERKKQNESDEKKKISEAKRKKLIDDQKRLLVDVKNSIYSGKVKVVQAGHKTKNALLEVFLVSEDTIKRLFTKEGMTKAGDTISGIIEKGIYYAMPSIEGSLPHVKKKISMTGKQLLDILSGKKVVSDSSAKKEDIKQTDEVQ